MKVPKVFPFFIFLLIYFHLSLIAVQNSALWKLIYEGDYHTAFIICSQDKNSLLADNDFFSACIYALDKKEQITTSFKENCQSLSNSGNYLGDVCLCKIHRLNGEYEKAIASCKKAIEENPLSEISYLEVSKVYSETDRHLKALEYINKGIEISGENFFLLRQKGFEEEKLSSYDRAAHSYQKALSILNKIVTKSSKISKFMEIKINTMKDLAHKEKILAQKSKFKKCFARYKKSQGRSIKEKYKLAKECLSYSNNEPEFLYEFAGLCYDLDLNKDALKYYVAVLPQIEDAKKRLLVYERIGELYLKAGNKNLAEKYIERAYKMGSRNVRLLDNYADILEKSSKYEEAIKVYEYLFKLSSKDSIREKIDILKDKILTPNEVLSELKKRGVILNSQDSLSPEDRKNFFRIRAAERRGAVAYLKKKYPGYANLYLDITDGKNFRQLLTWYGYRVYIKNISQLAIRFFEEYKITLDDVFRLRNKYGEPIFTPQGELTDEGLEAYFTAVESGKKTWIMPYEEVLSHEEQNIDAKEIESANAEIKRLLSLGYVEISESEYLWLAMATECPDEVLQSKPCNIQVIKVGKKLRYFICAVEVNCTDESVKLFSYIVRYRDGDTSIPKENRGTDFFSSPGNPSRRFCYKNKIWNGVD